MGALSTGTVFAANVILNTGERIFFDGGDDTSIREGFANRIFFADLAPLSQLAGWRKDSFAASDLAATSPETRQRIPLSLPLPL